MSDANLDAPMTGQQNKALEWAWRVSLALLILFTLVLAWLVAVGNLFTSGSNLGYNLGLAGGLMMLSMLLYPLRKRVRFLDRLGKMESWFRYHMFMGIAGPVLVLFHSTFKIGSMNSSIALYSMLLVALSGVIGRFVYRQIHRGLYGKELTLAGAEGQLKASRQQLGSVFSLSPDIEQSLTEFSEYANTDLHNIPKRLWRFLTLRYQGRSLAKKMRHEIKKTLAREAHKQNWSKGQLRLNYLVARKEVDNYIYAIIQCATLGSWLKLFSLWHIAHVPFIYMLALSGVAHVIAVHLY